MLVTLEKGICLMPPFLNVNMPYHLRHLLPSINTSWNLHGFPKMATEIANLWRTTAHIYLISDS